MPLRFACPHCQQKLSVSPELAGSKRNCPKCKQLIAIPQPQPTAATGVVPITKGATVAAAKTGPTRPPAFDQFEVYDDEAELHYDTESPTKGAGGAPKLVDRISVPRWTIYAQGGMLAGLSFACFLLGLCAGGFGSGGGTSTGGQKNGDLYGRVSFELAQRQTGDDGAMVIALPQKRVPDEKAPTADLFPETAVAPPTHRGMVIIRLIGGDCVRTDKDGNFKMQLPRGEYFILVISNIKQRPANVDVATADVAQMGRFLEVPLDFIGRKMYRWDKVTLRGNQRYDVAFD